MTTPQSERRFAADRYIRLHHPSATEAEREAIAAAWLAGFEEYDNEHETENELVGANHDADILFNALEEFVRVDELSRTEGVSLERVKDAKAVAAHALSEHQLRVQLSWSNHG